ncbi:hypothetical protein ACFYON_17455 [Micromonospora sp. NPDC005686]|uniref:hypothetical protein n=1 Tax=unclassified Micromonospora TaxID=2617518 RepID=UPI0033A77691
MVALAALVGLSALEHEDHPKRLAELPETPDRWEDVPTGETFRQVWDRDPEGRNEILRTAGVRVFVTREPRRRGTPADVRFTMGEFDDPEARRLAEIAAEEAF